jgi:hypothetical protein
MDLFIFTLLNYVDFFMKHLVVLLFAFITSTQGFSIARFIYVEAKVVSCQNLTYDIIIHTTYPTGSDLLFGGVELNFGDGIREEFPYDRTEFTLISKDLRYRKIVRRHAYPGPGNYTIGARIFNRMAEIENMARSVNTPLYVETRITLDPMIGCNNTPELENIPYLRYKGFNKYLQDFSVLDQENDSISFTLTRALQDKNLPVVNFKFLSEYDETGYRKISRSVIDPFSGRHFFNSMHTEGFYSIVINMTEWRKIENKYYKISQSMIDYAIELLDTENQPPVISGIKDTVLIIGSGFSNTITGLDVEGDSLQMQIYGDFTLFADELPLNKPDFFPAAISYELKLMPDASHVRSKPYKILASATDHRKNFQSLNQTQSAFIWVTDREHQPDAPPKLITQLLGEGNIGIYWDDTNDELGYILERADRYFPEYEKIAVLPANSTSFIDSSAVENNTYQYRIKAVGTQMSSYTTSEIMTPDVITAVVDPSFNGKATVFPNPCSGNFTISSPGIYTDLNIMDLKGNRIFTSTLYNSHQYTNSHPLPSGTYILNLSSAGASERIKLLVLP